MRKRSEPKETPPFHIKPTANGFQVLDRQQKSHGTYKTKQLAQDHIDELLGIKHDTPTPPPQPQEDKANVLATPAV